MAAAQKILGRLGQIGIGLAVAGGVAQSALYNGKLHHCRNLHAMLVCRSLSSVRTSLTARVSVDGGQRAVIFDRFSGVKPDVSGEGTHFLIPWVQRPIIFDIRSTPRAIQTVTGSKGRESTGIHEMLVDAFQICKT